MNERDTYLVVGIECRTSKNSGNTYKMLHLSQPFSDVKYGVGSKTCVEYVSDKNLPKGLKVNDTVRLSYGRAFDGKAYVSGAQIVTEDIPTVKQV